MTLQIISDCSEALLTVGVDVCVRELQVAIASGRVSLTMFCCSISPVSQYWKRDLVDVL